MDIKFTKEELEQLRFGVTGEGMHVDQLLSNVAMNYRPVGLIADMIFPMVPVQFQSDRYAVFTRQDAFRVEDDVRAPGTEAHKIDRRVSSDTYYAKNYALKTAVTIEDKANADPIFVAKILNDRTQFVTSKLLLSWESRIAAQVTNTANVGSSSAISSSWTDLTNSDPLGDLNTALDNVGDATGGTRPNRVVFSDLSWRLFRRNTTVRNLIFGTNNGGGFASREAVRDLLEVDQVLVGGGFEATNNEAQSETLSRLWGDHVLAFYAPPAPSTDVPSFGYSFRWVKDGLANMTAERHPFDPKTKSEEIEVGFYQDERITGSEYSFLLRGVGSST